VLPKASNATIAAASNRPAAAICEAAANLIDRQTTIALSRFEKTLGGEGGFGRAVRIEVVGDGNAKARPKKR
jgi:hypothetical protein